jgi:hypothetical protein
MLKEPLFYIGDDMFPVFQYLSSSPRYDHDARADIRVLEGRVARLALPAMGVFLVVGFLAMYLVTFEDAVLTQASFGAIVIAGIGFVWITSGVMSRIDSAKKLQRAIRDGKEREVIVTREDYSYGFAVTKQGKPRVSIHMPVFLISEITWGADRLLRQEVELTAEGIETRFRAKLRVIEWARESLGDGEYLHRFMLEAERERGDLIKRAKEVLLEKQGELAEVGRGLSKLM